MFGREKTFGQTNAADFAAGSEALKHFGNLNTIITGLDKAKAAQQGGGVTAKSVLLDGLRLDVQNVTRTARAMDQDDPGLADQFPPPASASDHDLLTCADNILSRLAPDPADDAATKAAKTALVAKFVAHELPADFVTHLQADRDAIDSAEDDVEGDDEEGVASTSAVGRLIRDGMKETHYLDAIMHNKYAFNPDKLRAWMSASHIERAAQHAKPAPAPTPATKPA
jgi:hypothetical protein